MISPCAVRRSTVARVVEKSVAMDEVRRETEERRCVSRRVLCFLERRAER